MTEMYPTSCAACLAAERLCSRHEYVAQGIVAFLEAAHINLQPALRLALQEQISCALVQAATEAVGLESLRSYARWAGEDWKKQLSLDWSRAGSRYPGDWGPLQRLRNTKGPQWLHNLAEDIGQ